MQRLEDGIEIFRLLTTGEPVSFRGRHFQLDNARYHPRPVQLPHPPIWIGANRPQLGLPLVGRQADVWHGWGGGYAGKWEVVQRSAEKAGRDPNQIVRSSSLSISEPWADVRRVYNQHLANGVSYLIVEWPSEGQRRLDEFVETVMPDLD
jgi:alkanesulfonate monooxygenase SsuD/methylene tetrahydromethanopterin reductase-like flavin-dependent oxidoreductase (luciferase family)